MHPTHHFILHASMRLHLTLMSPLHAIKFEIQTLNQSLTSIMVEEGRKLMGTHMPSHHTIKIFNFDFFEYFDQVPKCSLLAFKCYSDALLAEWWLSGCFGRLKLSESGPWGKDAASGLKMSPTTQKMDPDHTFFTFWIFPFKPLKNGLKNGFFFSRNQTKF